MQPAGTAAWCGVGPQPMHLKDGQSLRLTDLLKVNLLLLCAHSHGLACSRAGGSRCGANAGDAVQQLSQFWGSSVWDPAARGLDRLGLPQCANPGCQGGAQATPAKVASPTHRQPACSLARPWLAMHRLSARVERAPAALAHRWLPYCRQGFFVHPLWELCPRKPDATASEREGPMGKC